MNISCSSSRVRKGFTLIELLMCLAIMMLMTGTILWKYPDSTVKMNVVNDTHLTALFVREAQLKGSSVDSLAGSVGGYGVFFDSATTSQVVLFKDRVDPDISTPYGLGIGNGLYDSIPSDYSKDEYKSVTVLQPRYTFKKLCVQDPDNVTKFLCNNEVTPHIKTLTISFSRPSSVAHIFVNADTAKDYSSACIQINSPRADNSTFAASAESVGHIRSVQIYHSGMITTSASGCE